HPAAAHPFPNEAQNIVQDDQPSKTAASPALPSVGSATNDNYISEAASLVPGPSPDSSTNNSTNSSPAGDTTEQTTVSVTVEADADAEHEDELTTATAVVGLYLATSTSGMSLRKKQIV
ncbi:hypothetical protein LTR86_011275, partial [Recurvomyces mirabilis]